MINDKSNSHIVKHQKLHGESENERKKNYYLESPSWLIYLQVCCRTCWSTWIQPHQTSSSISSLHVSSYRTQSLSWYRWLTWPLLDCLLQNKLGKYLFFYSREKKNNVSSKNKIKNQLKRISTRRLHVPPITSVGTLEKR